MKPNYTVELHIVSWLWLGTALCLDSKWPPCSSWRSAMARLCPIDCTSILGVINDPCPGEDSLIKISIEGHTMLLCSTSAHHQCCDTILHLFLWSKPEGSRVINIRCKNDSRWARWQITPSRSPSVLERQHPPSIFPSWKASEQFVPVGCN